MHRLRYVSLAALLMGSQQAIVALIESRLLWHPEFNLTFWLLPLRHLIGIETLSPAIGAFAILWTFAGSAALVAISYQRAKFCRQGFEFVALAVVPAIQFVAVLALTILPARKNLDEATPAAGGNFRHALQGLLAGTAIIVIAVLVSALTLGTYGWGLFVLTPLTVGLATGYIANRDTPLEWRQTAILVLGTTALGAVALIMFALEGLVCLLLASPIVVFFALLGGAMGGAAGLASNSRGKPLLTLGLLPLAFLVEAAVPPSAAFRTEEAIDIQAPREAIWQAIVSDKPIAEPPGLIAATGLAYAVKGEMLGTGVGATRLGRFSTGTAREKITDWQPGRRLAFAVLTQPPCMEEMSPYRRVHSPHVRGYFQTLTTSFELHPLAAGGTRLIVRSSHILRIDPLPYWEPIARWAAHSNAQRVLRDLKHKAERLRPV